MDNRYMGEWTVSRLVSKTSKVFHEAGIPHVLWGDFALCLYGIPGCPHEYSFVVPDKHMREVHIQMSVMDFPHCGDWPNRCRFCKPKKKDIALPIPEIHRQNHKHDWIFIYKQSDVLWLMDIESALPGAEGEQEQLAKGDLILSSDPRLPPKQEGPLSKQCGPFPSADDPDLRAVHLPSATRVLESYLLLFARDQADRISYYWSYRVSMLAEFTGTKHGLIQADKLPEICQEAYELLLAGNVDESYMKVRQTALHKSLMPPEKDEKEDGKKGPSALAY